MFPSDTHGVAGDTGRFDYKDENGTFLTADAFWGSLETRGGNIIDGILNAQSIDWMQESDRHDLSMFIAAMMLGSSHTRFKLHHDFPNEIATLIEAGYVLPQNCDPCDAAQAVFGNAVQEAAAVAPYVLNKIWTLRHSRDGRYITSDNPIACFNHVNSERGFNLAIGADHWQGFFPLNAHFSLHLSCPRNLLSLSDLPIWSATSATIVVDTETQLYWANVLQLHSAERQVYGTSGDDLAFIPALVDEFRELDGRRSCA